jgi:hypothetical protein
MTTRDYPHIPLPTMLAIECLRRAPFPSKCALLPTQRQHPFGLPLGHGSNRFHGSPCSLIGGRSLNT